MSTPEAAATEVLLIIGSNDILFRTGSSPSAVSARAELSSDAGSETVTLVESDAWLHGSAPLERLPLAAAALTFTVYDSGSASLISFSGLLDADGGVYVEEDVTGKGVNPDIEVRAVQVFDDGAGGHALAFDLAGADVWDVAYAAITIVESNEVTSCEKGGVCTTTGSTTTTEAEVDWDDLGSIWSGTPTLAHSGLVTAMARTLDAEGKKVQSTTAQRGAAWEDGAAGVSTLAIDEDPLTRVALVQQRSGTWDEPMEVPFAALVSEGWSRTNAPVAASVAWASGDTDSIPMNSYQVASRVKINHPFENVVISHLQVDVEGRSWSIDGESIIPVDALTTPRCAAGVCLLLEDTGGLLSELSVTAYAGTISALATGTEIRLVYFDAAGEPVNAESLYPHFQDDVQAVAGAYGTSVDTIG